LLGLQVLDPTVARIMRQNMPFADEKWTFWPKFSNFYLRPPENETTLLSTPCSKNPGCAYALQQTGFMGTVVLQNDTWIS